MKRMMLAMLCGLLVMGCAACDETGYYEPEETTNADETEEAPTEQPTLSEEDIADLLAQTTPAATSAYVEAPEEENTVQGEFGVSVFLVKNEEENTERYFLFYEGGSGAYLEQENGTGMGFTYELDGEEGAVFHFGTAEDVTKANVYWLDNDHAEISWEDGAFEELTRLPNDPGEEFRFYHNEVLRERASNVYAKKNGYRPSEMLIWYDYDETISIQMIDEVDGETFTGDWYTIDRYTGIGTNLMGERIDLSDNAGAEAVSTGETTAETVPGETEAASETAETTVTTTARR